MNNQPTNWLRRLRRRSNDIAQKGVTLQEVLIGIAVAAVIAASSIFLGARFIGQGQFASARQTLSTAQLATEQVYSSIIEGGGRNFTGLKIDEASAAVAYATSQTSLTVNNAATPNLAQFTENADVLSKAAAEKLNALGEDVTFIPFDDHTSNDTCPAPAGTAAKSVCPGSSPVTPGNLTNLTEKEVWVQVLPKGDGLSTHGQAIRLGMRASNGSTLCVIIVKQASNNSNLGRMYESKNSSQSTSAPAVCNLGVLLDDTAHLPAATAPGTYSTTLTDPS